MRMTITKTKKNAESTDTKAKAIVDRIMQENEAFKSNDEMSSIQNNASNETTCTNGIENVNVNTDRNEDVDSNVNLNANQSSNTDLNANQNADEKVGTNFENKVENLNESSEKFETIQQDEQAVAEPETEQSVTNSNNFAEIKTTAQDEQNSAEVENNELESDTTESGKTEEHDQRFLKMYEKKFWCSNKEERRA